MNFLKGKYGDEQIDCSLDLSIDRTYRSNQELIMMRDDRSSNGYSESTYGDDKHSNHESLTTHHGGNLRQQGSKRDLSHDRNENDLKEEKWNGYCCWCCCPRIYSSNAITETNLQLNRPLQIPSTKFQRISTLLNEEMAYQLYNMLPESARLAQPVLVYSTRKDGWSMNNLLGKTEYLDPVIILIRSLKSKILIGGYSTARLSPPSNRIRGTGECFVFRLSPIPAAYYWTYIPSMKKESHNQFVVSCHDYIAFGGSEEFGTNAIRLDNDLRTCDSGPTDTYLNPSTLVPEESINGISGPFAVENIEVIQITGIVKRRS